MYVHSASVKKHSSTIPVGEYRSVCTKIDFHPDYADEEAIKVEYEITSESGQKFAYSEVFYNTTANDRTVQFFDYVDEAGIPDAENGLPDLVGRRENIVLKKRANYRNPVIIERNFIVDEDAAE